MSHRVHGGPSDRRVVGQDEVDSHTEHLSNCRPWDRDRTYGGPDPSP